MPQDAHEYTAKTDQTGHPSLHKAKDQVVGIQVT